MTRSLAAVLLLLLPATLIAQTAQTSDLPTLRAGTRIVVLDITAKDANGKSTHGLPRSEFQVFEDGKLQQTRRFVEHTYTDPKPLPPQPPSQPGIFTNAVQMSMDGPLNVVLLDMLNTPLTDQVFVRQQLQHFVKSIKPGQRIAIFGLTSRLIMLQGFTSDPAVLLAAIQKKALRESPLRDEAVSDDSFTDNQPDMAQASAAMQEFNGQVASERLRFRIEYTIAAFNQLSQFLSAFPGRKNIIWFSGAFPQTVLPDSTLDDPFSTFLDMSREFQSTGQALMLSQIAVYPIDARGLQVPPMLNAENSGAKYVRNPQAFGNDLSRWSQVTAEEQMTMRQIASDTGGEAYVNTNDLSSAVNKAIQNGSNYYTVDYTPPEHRQDGSFHKIKVVSIHGYALTYRTGYYEADAVQKKRKKADAPAAPSTEAVEKKPTPMQLAMLHGAPDLTRILFRERITPLGTEVGGSQVPTVANGVQTGPKVKGPFKNFDITVSAASGNIGEHMPDGTRRLAVEFVALVYNADGELISTTSQALSGLVKPEQYANFARSGLQQHMIISVPAKCECYLRTGIHDQMNGTIGTLEVPTQILAKLPAVDLH